MNCGSLNTIHRINNPIRGTWKKASQIWKHCAYLTQTLRACSSLVHHEFFRLTPEVRGSIDNVISIFWNGYTLVLPALGLNCLPLTAGYSTWQCASSYVTCGRLISEKWNDPNVTLSVFAKYGTMSLLGTPKSQKSVEKHPLGKQRRNWTNYDADTEGAYTRRIWRLFRTVGGALVQVR